MTERLEKSLDLNLTSRNLQILKHTKLIYRVSTPEALNIIIRQWEQYTSGMTVDQLSQNLVSDNEAADYLANRIVEQVITKLKPPPDLL
jgi:hypothetical protein